MDILKIVGVMIGLVIYFIPCLVASRRDHRNAMPIFILNLLLGWTFIGWVTAMVWAFTDNVKPKNPNEGG